MPTFQRFSDFRLAWLMFIFTFTALKAFKGALVATFSRLYADFGAHLVLMACRVQFSLNKNMTFSLTDMSTGHFLVTVLLTTPIRHLLKVFCLADLALFRVVSTFESDSLFHTIVFEQVIKNFGPDVLFIFLLAHPLRSSV